MPAVADLIGPSVLVGVPKEFHGPIDYADRWIWLALIALSLVGLYYAAVLLLTRARPTTPSPAPPPPPDLRARHLARIDDIAGAVQRGELSARDGHQQLSEVVRSYVEEITPLPARRMTLADLRLRGPRPLTEMIAEMYPPEFAPDDGEAAEHFERALLHARGLVSTWRR